MSVTYRAVGWNANKRRYDTVAGGVVLLYLTTFVGLHWQWQPAATIETILIRAVGTAAFLLLHAILAIGPLALGDLPKGAWRLLSADEAAGLAPVRAPDVKAASTRPSDQRA